MSEPLGLSPPKFTSVKDPSRRWRKLREKSVELLLFLAAFSSVLITFGIVYTLVSESIPFFDQVSLKQFLLDRDWTPTFENAKYGIFVILSGTFLSTFVALIVALPIGLISAAFMSEFIPASFREIVKPVLELLAAVPTVVYGYFALLFVTPLLQEISSEIQGFNILSAGLVIGIMIVPYVSSLSEDAMKAVPQHLREASYAMGSTKFQTTFRVVIPSAFSGITSAYILGISRALGETMVVAIAAGNQPNLTFDPREPSATVTAFIVQVALGDLRQGSIGYQSIYVAGLALFLVTLVFNILGLYVRHRFQERE